jgi:signal transduction histidine kinase/CheY-like chemotaxis protein
VKGEQIRTLYRQSAWIVALNPINAAVVGAVLRSPGRGGLIVAWLAASALAAAGRIGLAQGFRRLAPPAEALRRWGRLFVAGAGLSGLCWGAGSVLLYDPQAQLANVLLFFVVGGMAAGAAGTLACHLPAFLAFVAPALLPLSVRIFAEGGPLHLTMGALGLVYCAALVIIARNSHHAITESFRLRFANDELLGRLSRAQVSLEEANRTLEQRVDERSRELQRQTEALDEARRMESLGLLVGGVAHDFNNLLTVILGNVTVLLDRPGVAAEASDALGQIQEAAGRAAWLVSQLLASSRRQVRKPRVLDLNGVVSGAHRLLARLIGEHVELVVALSARPLLVEADPGQLEQVIVNLATNARDAMPSGGRLTIETEAVTVDGDGAALAPGLGPGDYVMLSVRDTGVGMDAETRRMAFHPFFTTKEVGHGTGLGLATVNGVVEQSGGRVFVESEPGAGSCFRVLLPRAAAAAAPVEPPAPAAPAAGRAGTVLLVEDEPMVRTVASQALGGAGLTVLEAGSGEQALERARAHAGPIDLLVTDVVMSRMGGPELAALLKADRPDVRVLFVSGYSRDAHLPASDVAAGVDFLEKPFTPTGIVDRAFRLLAAAPAAPGQGPTPALAQPRGPGARRT